MKTLSSISLLVIATLFFCNCSNKNMAVTIDGVWRFNYDSFSYQIGKSYAAGIDWNFKDGELIWSVASSGQEYDSFPYRLIDDTTMIWTNIAYSGTTPVYSYDTVTIQILTSNRLFLSYNQTYEDASNVKHNGKHYRDLIRW